MPPVVMPPVGSRPSTQRPVLAIITDGGYRTDRSYLEDPVRRPPFPTCTIYCNELPGTTPIERGNALLEQISALHGSGELPRDVPTVLLFHGVIDNGELMLCDSEGRFMIHALVLLSRLSQTDEAASAAPPAPILLSCCHAKRILPSLGQLARPVLLNGGKHELGQLDAECVYEKTLGEVENAWRSGEALSTRVLFDALSCTSGETLRLAEHGRCIAHHPLRSATDIDQISGNQEILHLRAVMAHGRVNRLAETLQALGFEAFLSYFDPSGNPALWYLVDVNARDLFPKVALLLALGEPVDQANACGNTLLHDACTNAGGDDEDNAGAGRMARLLLANGADPLAVNAEGKTPADLAREAGDAGLAALLAGDDAFIDRASYQPARLLQRAREQEWNAVVALLEEIAEPDAGDAADAVEDGLSPRCARQISQISENSDS